MNRVVITGMGMITALGWDLPTVWRRLLAGDNGIGLIRSFDASAYPCKVAAEVTRIDGSEETERDSYRDNYPTESGIRSIPGKCCRCGVQLFLKAAKEAYTDSGLDHFDMEPTAMGVASGASVTYIDHDSVLEHSRLRTEDGRSVDLRRFAECGIQSPHSFWRRLGDMMAVVPAKVLHLAGPTIVTDTACAASSHAIGEAFRLVRRGTVKAMIAGGASALVAPIGILYFAVLGALSRNPDPHQASRPFDRDRDGFVMGEGGGAVVLEDLGHAQARGAKIYAEVAGFASTMSAHNLTDPSPDGAIESATMQLALRDGSIPLEELDYIAAHGTSTPKNDATETAAIKKAFGNRARGLMVSSNKGQIGHTIAGAGVCNVITAAKAIQEHFAPPTMHYSNADADCDLDYVPNVSRSADIRVALANAFAFGGQNAVVALRALPV
ncbi:MAG: beta-ketoacyl-[acyl-carrier-protein] synthase family protein [Acidobacteria bacterium]|nr:beta-ketoacyl-[acyl-carrier-protein] synthase family protein [Acidobacteriota bacterium]